MSHFFQTNPWYLIGWFLVGVGACPPLLVIGLVINNWLKGIRSHLDRWWLLRLHKAHRDEKPRPGDTWASARRQTQSTFAWLVREVNSEGVLVKLLQPHDYEYFYDWCDWELHVRNNKLYIKTHGPDILEP